MGAGMCMHELVHLFTEDGGHMYGERGKFVKTVRTLYETTFRAVGRTCALPNGSNTLRKGQSERT